MNRELKENKTGLDNVLRRIPIGWIGTPEEVANVVGFLASGRLVMLLGQRSLSMEE